MGCHNVKLNGGVHNNLKYSSNSHVYERSLCCAYVYSFTVHNIGGGRVVRWCWVNFQCRGVLQF